MDTSKSLSFQKAAHFFEGLKQYYGLDHPPARQEPLRDGFQDSAEIIAASAYEDPVGVGKGADRL